MGLIDSYFEHACQAMDQIRKTQGDSILRAAELMADVIEKDGVVYVFGTGGHSNIGAEEMFWRAGGLASVSAILDPGINLAFGAQRSSLVERTPGYARAVLDSYGLKAGDVMIVVNAYGINSVTIDTALECRQRGVKVIGVTSAASSDPVPPDHASRHPSKKNLHEIVDVHVDTQVPFGDAVVEVEGSPQKVGPLSTILNAFAINSMVITTADLLAKRGYEPPVWRSGNIPGGIEAGKKLMEKYAPKARLL
ncbi:MAG TPA: SIS domain-containing protein [Chloroflexota bacterium]|nr:SIS domain-containing protein [Chloroflexota bacterium]